jgi:hypothetical protein
MDRKHAVKNPALWIQIRTGSINLWIRNLDIESRSRKLRKNALFVIFSALFETERYKTVQTGSILYFIRIGSGFNDFVGSGLSYKTVSGFELDQSGSTTLDKSTDLLMKTRGTCTIWFITPGSVHIQRLYSMNI